MPAYFGAEQMKKPNQMVALQFNEVVKAHAKSLIKQNDTYNIIIIWQVELVRFSYLGSDNGADVGDQLLHRYFCLLKSNHGSLLYCLKRIPQLFPHIPQLVLQQ